MRRICEQAAEAIAYGANILVLSDRGVGPRARRDPVAARGRRRAPPPRARGHAPAGRPRARVGRAARGPPLRDADRLRRVGDQPVPDARVARSDVAAPGELEQAERNVVKAIGKGLLKTLSKMGISTIQSYNGAQIFEAVGLAPELVERHFTGTASRIGGIGLDVLARETLDAPPARVPGGRRAAPVGGDLRLAARRRAPPVEPEGDRQAPARRAPRRPRRLRRVGGGDQRGRRRARAVAARAARAAIRRRRRRSRSTRSSRRARSSSASRPARCRSARSRARRTRRSRSR